MIVKLFAFQKEEDDILEDWIRYHSEIFGRENIYIMDHMSEDGTYELMQDMGVNARRIDCRFYLKYWRLSIWMRQVREEADILIPLDVDEFVSVKDGEGFKLDKDSVFCELQKCNSENTIYGFNIFDSITDNPDVEDPLSDIVRFSNHASLLPKFFFSSRTFEETAQGNHSGKLSVDSKKEPTSLSLLHYSDRGIRHFVKKHMRWNDSYGKSFVNGSGSHWKKTYYDIELTDNIDQLYRKFVQSRDIRSVEFLGLRSWKDNCFNNTRILKDKLGTNEGTP